MEITAHECLFLGDKLGMLFNSNDGKVTVVGLDSKQYHQSSRGVLSATPLKLAATDEDVEHEECMKYEDAITLVPAGAGDEDGFQENIDDGAGSESLGPSDSIKMTAAEVLSAFVNFEDGDDQGQQSIIVVDDANSPAAANPSNEETAVASTHGFASEGFKEVSYSHASHRRIIRKRTTPFLLQNMIASDSYEDFQSTLESSGNTTKEPLHLPSPPPPPPPRHEAPGLSLPSLTGIAEEGDIDLVAPELDSPFGGRAVEQPSLADTPTAPSPAPPYEPPAPGDEPTPHAETDTTAVPEAPPTPVLFLTPPGSATKRVEHAGQQAGTQQAGGSVDATPTTAPAFDRSSAQKIARLFGPSVDQPSKSASHTVHEHTTWAVHRADSELFMMHTIDRVNSVQVRDLDSAFQLALIKQRHRPLALKFRPPNNREAFTPVPSEAFGTGSTAGHVTEAHDSARSALSGVADGRQSPSSSRNGSARVPVPTAPVEKFKYSLFMAKYTSTAAARVRSTVDTTLQDYVQCDWAAAKLNGEGLPQTTIVSIYKYIEHEMVKLELFNHAHARGYGVPAVMQESHWEDVRNHIESLVFRAVGPFTRTLWPIFSEDTGFDYVDTDAVVSDLKANTFIGVDLNVLTLEDAEREETAAPGRHNAPERTLSSSVDYSDPSVGEPTVELSREHPLRMKLAFLRFVTLESTGLDCGVSVRKARSNSVPEGSHPVALSTQNSGSMSTLTAAEKRAKTVAVVEKMRTINRLMLGREEWYLAMRGLCRSLQLETPGEVLHALANTVKLISHALDAYLNNYPSPEDGETTEEAGSSLQATEMAVAAASAGVPNLTCSCGAIHLKTEQDEYTVRRDAALLGGSSESQYAAFSTVASPVSPDGTVPAESLRSVVNDILEGRSILRACNDKPKREPRILSADDLMPAITYVLIQANPPNIEYVLWMCAEFRNPALLRGEEAFCLAQLSSAMEFCKHADHKAFDIPHSVYNTCMLGYTATLKLLVACKTDDLPLVRDLIEQQHADVNGLSPDHKDSPLTACIRFGRHAILRYLLTLPSIDVNQPVQLFHGPNQRTTPLILATRYNQLEMVIDLLVAGADRNYCDDSGVSALSIADENDFTLLQIVLQTGPGACDLVQCIAEGDQVRTVALLLQRVDVNCLDYPARMRSPLMAAVIKRDIHTLRFLMNRQLCQLDVDLANAQGHTALMICAQEFTRTPCVEYLHIAGMLLRYGADRYVTDCSGRTGLDYIKEAREELRALERELLNPFQPAGGAGGVATPLDGSPRDVIYRLNPFLTEREDDPLPTPRAPPLPQEPSPSAPPLPPPPPAEPVPVSAAFVSAPTKKRHSAPPAPTTPPPPLPPLPESEAVVVSILRIVYSN
jgi:ankyrin repeat protein